MTNLPEQYAGTEGDDYNWTAAKIVGKITDYKGREYTIDVFNRLTVTKEKVMEYNNGVGNYRFGYTRYPGSIEFDIIIPHYSKAANLLRGLRDAETRFKISYFDLNGSGQFKVNREKLQGCVIETEAQEYETEGPPTTTFSGKALSSTHVETVSTDDFSFLEKRIGREIYLDSTDASAYLDYIDENIW